MRKLRIDNYEFKREDTSITYMVRESLADLLLHRELRLSAAEAIRRHTIAKRILECPNDEILLEDADYERIKSSLDLIHGFGREDIELIERIYNAEEVSHGNIKTTD